MSGLWWGRAAEMLLTADELVELTGKTRRAIRVERDGATSGAVALARKSA